MQRGIVAILLPATSLSSSSKSAMKNNLVMSMCENYHIPCLSTEGFDKDFTDRQHRPFEFMINIAPERGILAKAIGQLIENLDWSSFIILYEHNSGMQFYGLRWHKNGFRKLLKI